MHRPFCGSGPLSLNSTSNVTLTVSTHAIRAIALVLIICKNFWRNLQTSRKICVVSQEYLLHTVIWVNKQSMKEGLALCSIINTKILSANTIVCRKHDENQKKLPNYNLRSTSKWAKTQVFLFVTEYMLSLQVKFLGTGTSTLTMMYQEIPEPDNCLGNQCAEGSTCVDGQFEYICQCPENRGGRYCQGKNGNFCLWVMKYKV